MDRCPSRLVRFLHGECENKKKTCGPSFLYGLQKLQRKFWSESHHFGEKTEQSTGVNFGVAGYRSSYIFLNVPRIMKGRSEMLA